MKKMNFIDPSENQIDSLGTYNNTLDATGEKLYKFRNAIDEQTNQMVEKIDQVWTCKLCGKRATNKTNIRRHAETHIGGMSYNCHLCSKSFPAKHPLQKHISNIHCELFSCEICGKSGMTRDMNRYHKKKHQNNTT